MKTGGTSIDGLLRCAINRNDELWREVVRKQEEVEESQAQEEGGEAGDATNEEGMEALKPMLPQDVDHQHDSSNNNKRINYSRMSECGSQVRRCMSTMAEELGASVESNVFVFDDEDNWNKVEKEVAEGHGRRGLVEDDGESETVVVEDETVEDDEGTAIEADANSDADMDETIEDQKVEEEEEEEEGDDEGRDGDSNPVVDANAHAEVGVDEDPASDTDANAYEGPASDIDTDANTDSDADSNTDEDAHEDPDSDTDANTNINDAANNAQDEDKSSSPAAPAVAEETSIFRQETNTFRHVFDPADLYGSPSSTSLSTSTSSSMSLSPPSSSFLDPKNICGTSQSNVMSYCASLHSVRTFGWANVDKITVIRNPVDRAWSMYRFSLNRCYNCQPLADILEKVYAGEFHAEDHQRNGSSGSTSSGSKYVYDPNDSCAVQMIGHQATNLISSVDLYNVANDVTFPREREIVQEAVRNLREEFTWIGLTDRLEESVAGFREVFPFLAEELEEVVVLAAEEGEGGGDGDFDDHGDSDSNGIVAKVATTCPFGHRNAGGSPKCGTQELDDRTISLIRKLNRRDEAVYRAAVERFEIQEEVLAEVKSELMMLRRR